MKIPYRCDMLVDQDRYIGSDPVGYRCMGEAAFESGCGMLFCAECKAILEESPNRLTFPIYGYGKENQDRIYKNLFGEAVRHEKPEDI